MKTKYLISIGIISCLGFTQCSRKENTLAQTVNPNSTSVVVDTFADIQVLKYDLPGWDQLTAKQKELIYYLSEAALAGRDIMWDQNCKENLYIRKCLEQILSSNKVDRTNAQYPAFETYAKRVFFSNGIHHHYNEEKIKPEFSKEYWISLLQQAGLVTKEFDASNHSVEVIFGNKYLKRTNKAEGVDMLQASAMNYYEGVTQNEAENFYKNLSRNQLKEAPSFGLNSKLTKENGQLMEKVWKIGGMYDASLKKVNFWLAKAQKVAENPIQAKAIGLLMEFYQTGDLKKFDEFNIAWVSDNSTVVDFIHGFIEVYIDPIGKKGSFESAIEYKDPEATQKMKVIAENAQWFEDHSTIPNAYKKSTVTGISYNVINVAMESGDAAPSTAIGVNLPNADWIREKHGSKSVSLNNIILAYDRAAGPGALKEFAFDQAEMDRADKYGELSDKLHTALHEVIGHASGKLKENIAPPHETLKNYSSTLEEARADLVALYYLMDPKLVEMNVMPDLECGKSEYDRYIRNGMMTQLRRLEMGQNLEEDHMRNRQLVASWVYEKGKDKKVIEKIIRNGKTYFVVHDYNQLRILFGNLLAEIQRIKSEGDYAAAKKLVETYGVQVDQKMLAEVKARFATIPTKPYSGFIQPRLIPVYKNGQIVNVLYKHDETFMQQMLRFGKSYGYLPVNN
jgi:dipeptidyl-peptidase-3